MGSTGPANSSEPGGAYEEHKKVSTILYIGIKCFAASIFSLEGVKDISPVSALLPPDLFLRPLPGPPGQPWRTHQQILPGESSYWSMISCVVSHWPIRGPNKYIVVVLNINFLAIFSLLKENWVTINSLNSGETKISSGTKVSFSFITLPPLFNILCHWG